MENDGRKPSMEEEALVEDLRRLRPMVPPADLEARIFEGKVNGVFRELVRLAAMLLIYLGLAFALFPARSGIPDRKRAGGDQVERPTISTISVIKEKLPWRMGGLYHD
jgi:hypothetical protein